MSGSQLNTFPETWKAIPGLEGYDVSDQGRVRSYWRRDGSGATRPGAKWVLDNEPQKFLSQHFASFGYPLVKIKIRSYPVHRLMLLAFMGPCPPGHESCHSDDDPKNYSLENLRWGTHSENMIDKFKNGYSVKGTRHPGAKLTEVEVRQIRELAAQGYPQRDIAKMFHVCQSNISYINRREHWSHIPG